MSEIELLKRIEEERSLLERQVKEAVARENTITYPNVESEQLFSIMDHHIVYCAFGSKILQSSRQCGFEVHPLFEYFENI